MEFIQNLIVTVLLSVWVLISVAFLICMILNARSDRRREKRDLEREKRDLEYHEARMKAIK